MTSILPRAATLASPKGVGQGIVALAYRGSAGAAHDGGTDVRLLYFDGCPHWVVAEETLCSALPGIGRDDETIQRVLVETPEDADQRLRSSARRRSRRGWTRPVRDGERVAGSGLSRVLDPGPASRLAHGGSAGGGADSETRPGIRHRPLPRGRGCRAGAGADGTGLGWMCRQLLVSSSNASAFSAGSFLQATQVRRRVRKADHRLWGWCSTPSQRPDSGAGVSV